MSELNTSLQAVSSGTAIDLLNGGSVSGSVGFSAVQPAVRVSGLQVTNTDNSNGWDFIAYKGASAGVVTATQVAHVSIPGGSSAFVPLDLVLGPTDYLTAIAPQTGANGKLIVSPVASISI